MICAKDFGDAPLVHHGNSNAIGDGPCFVRTLQIKLHTLSQGLRLGRLDFRKRVSL
jgi:hypothetical protein